MPAQDFRARLTPKSLKAPAPSPSPGATVQTAQSNVQNNDVLGPATPSNLLFPLWSTLGVLFPYTPEVSGGNVSEYDTTAYIHSNYGYNAYIRSFPKPIELKATFTAQTNNEALYLLAVLQFFKSVTKSYFGVNPYEKSGTPPPTLIFNYLGDYQYNNVPVIVKEFSYTLPGDVDYVPVNTQLNQLYSSNIGVSLAPTGSSGYTYVPTQITVSLSMDAQYIPIQLRKQFNLDLFRQGKLMNNGYI